MSYLTKAKAVLSYYNDLSPSYQTEGAENLGAMPTDKARCYLMRVMVDWNERAAMMRCGDLTVEQAEMCAWIDLKMDEVFWSGAQNYINNGKNA